MAIAFQEHGKELRALRIGAIINILLGFTSILAIGDPTLSMSTVKVLGAICFFRGISVLALDLCYGFELGDRDEMHPIHLTIFQLASAALLVGLGLRLLSLTSASTPYTSAIGHGLAIAGIAAFGTWLLSMVLQYIRDELHYRRSLRETSP